MIAGDGKAGIVDDAVDENQHQTLEAIEGESWGDAPGDESYLVRTVHRLRRKPLGQFTVEDLRILLGQNVGVEYVLPRALDRLEQDPFAEGDYYPGDLLVAVMTLPAETWSKHPRWADLLQQIVSRVESVDPATNLDLSDMLLDKIRDFRERRARR